jgi:hypothetical protein
MICNSALENFINGNIDYKCRVGNIFVRQLIRSNKPELSGMCALQFYVQILFKRKYMVYHYLTSLGMGLYIIK